MTTIEIQKQKFTITELLGSLEQLKEKDLEQFTALVLNLYKSRKEKSVSEREIELLDVINEKFPKEVHERFVELNVKLENETITKPERKEFKIYVEKLEAMNNRRLKAILSLAKIRKISPEKLMQQLHIQPLPNHVK